MIAGATTDKPLGVLLIDSSKERFALVRHLLAESGRAYSVGWARSAEEARDPIRTGAYDVVMVNETLGDSTGLEVVWETASSQARSSVVLMAEKAKPGAAEEAENLGAADFLVWSELTPRFLDRSLSNAVYRRHFVEAKRSSAEDLVRRIIELEDSRDRLEQQTIEYVQMAEELAIVKSDLETALEEVGRSKAMLEKLVQEKNQLMSIIAHDLRSPFTVLMGMSQMMAEMSDRQTKESLSRQAKTVYEAARRTYSLLENLLEWSRLQMDQVRLAPEPLDLKALAGTSADLLQEAAATKKVALENCVPNDLRAQADRYSVDTVIRNLVNNAIKFTPTGGSVKIDGRKEDGRIAVSVADTGVGMKPEQIERLFSTGSQKSTPGTGGEKGTGLGLLLCRDLAERNGGAITVASLPGQGTTFTIWLPPV